MVFSSLTFLFVFLPITLIVMYVSPFKYRNLFLLILSLIFYGWGEPVYILLMLLSTIVDYFNGYYVDKYEDSPKIAFRFVIFSVVFNLGLLFFFKYFDFFAVNLNAIGIDFIKPLGLPLPIGISFYSFQTMSYPIDIYRKQAKHQSNIISFAAYVVMFPQLIAGPIVRYKDIATQLNKRDTNIDKFASGVDRFMIGLAKKVLLANNIGLVFDSIKALPPNQMSVALAWLGAIAFSFQIYFDFSAYSDMAIGLGRMLGFEFLENFNYPFIAKSITDFWRRWHISLSTFFRDNLYIPLGGNRLGIKRQMLNIFIVWFLTGFWHGAAWNFVLWGMFFAVVLIIEKLFLLDLLKKQPNFIQHLYTIILVLISFTIFSIENLGELGVYLSTMLFISGSPLINEFFIFQIRNNFIILIILFVASTPLLNNLYHKYFTNTKLEYFKPLMIGLVFIICIAFLVDASYNPFLYFRF